jgi:hypothetical protein
MAGRKPMMVSLPKFAAKTKLSPLALLAKGVFRGALWALGAGDVAAASP